ncbi:hypothetical protein M8C21_007381 [Ambrosia artemisiifolia]|uniref:Nucleobase-ascorbate transporter 6 n=1 Tax=Ambrosia artemisiifolia TaxID=4212 RepID=A0AAD5G417_AMBAR|nr:hypothetical protein M8C21_007381 [Ambrosia artemisiifolia]
MLGTTVIIPTALVPQMGGGNEEKALVIQTLLFVAGINTLLQSLFGTRLPAVIGASYTFVAPTISIILSGRWSEPNPVEKFKKTMRAIQGAMIIASTLQIVLGFSGLWRNIVRFLSPLSAVPLVGLAGFGLYEFGFPGVVRCVEVGLPQLIFLVIVSQYLSHFIHSGKNIFERFAVLISVAIIWTYAHLLTVGGAYNHAASKTQTSCRTDRAGLVGAAPWIRVPYPFQWGAPSFDAGEAFAMMMAAFVTLIESTGGFIAVSRYASATHMPSSILSRGIGWQLSVKLEMDQPGLLPDLATYRHRKFGAIFASIPAPIVAALYCLFFAYFNNMVNVPFSSEPFVAGILAYFLDNTLHKKDSSIRKDRGKHWWDKFQSFKTDARSEEFYSLPFNLNKHFPSV